MRKDNVGRHVNEKLDGLTQLPLPMGELLLTREIKMTEAVDQKHDSTTRRLKRAGRIDCGGFSRDSTL